MYYGKSEWCISASPRTVFIPVLSYWLHLLAARGASESLFCCVALPAVALLPCPRVTIVAFGWIRDPEVYWHAV